MPSSDQIVCAPWPSRSSSRDSIASAQGACTRPPNGVSTTTRQSPSSSRNRSTTIRRSVGRWPAISRSSADSPGRSPPPARPGRGARAAAAGLAPGRARRRRDRPRARERTRPAPAPARSAGPARRRARTGSCRARPAPATRPPGRADLFHPPARGPERDHLADAALVDHLLVELADPPSRSARLADQEDRVEPAVGNRPAAGDGHRPRVAPALDAPRLAVPHHARLQLGELVGRIRSGQHAKDGLERVAGQALVGRRPPHRLEQLVGRPGLADRHGHDLLGQHVERVARQLRLLDRALVHARASRPRISRRSPRYLGKKTPRLGSPTWCPARPTRCRPLATLAGLSTWITRSTAPMSMPSSSELVATIAGRRPALSASSIPTRCSRASEP